MSGLRSNSITIRERSFTVSELTAKQMSQIRKIMTDQPHNVDVAVASIGCTDPKMSMQDWGEQPNIFVKRVSAEVLRLSEEDRDPKAPPATPPAD